MAQKDPTTPWTPPSDAILVEEKSTWTPPSDAILVDPTPEKKNVVGASQPAPLRGLGGSSDGNVPSPLSPQEIQQKSKLDFGTGNLDRATKQKPITEYPTKGLEVPKEAIVGIGGTEAPKKEETYASAVVEQALNPPADIGQSFIDGQLVPNAKMRQYAQDRDFMKSFVAGERQVDIQGNTQLRDYVKKQGLALKNGADWYDNLVAGVIDAKKGAIGFADWTNDVLGELTGIPNFLEGIVGVATQKGQVGEIQKALAKTYEQVDLIENDMFEVDGQMTDLYRQGKWGEMGNLAVNTSARSAANSLLIGTGAALTGGLVAGGAAVAPIFVGGAYADQERNPKAAGVEDLSKFNRMITRPLAYGSAELTGEIISVGLLKGSTNIMMGSLRSTVKKVAETAGKEAAEQVAKEGAGTIAKNLFDVFVGNPSKEGFSEVLTFAQQKFTDKVLGINNESTQKILKDGINTWALGAASGGVTTAPQMAVTAISSANTARKKFVDYTIKNDPEGLTSLQEAIKENPEQYSTTEQDLKVREKAVNAVPDNLVEDTEVVDDVQKKQELEEKKRNLDPVFAKPIEEEIAKIDEILAKKAEDKQFDDLVEDYDLRVSDITYGREYGELSEEEQAQVDALESEFNAKRDDIIKKYATQSDKEYLEKLNKKINSTTENLLGRIGLGDKKRERINDAEKETNYVFNKIIRKSRNRRQEQRYKEYEERQKDLTSEEIASYERVSARSKRYSISSEWEDERIKQLKDDPIKFWKERLVYQEESLAEDPTSEYQKESVKDIKDEIARLESLSEKPKTTTTTEPVINSTPTDEKYASVNNNDGKGTVYLTKQEYLDWKAKNKPVTEQLTTSKTEQNAKEQQSEQMREQGVQEQPQGKSDSNMPIVNQTELQDGKTPKEEVVGDIQLSGLRDGFQAATKNAFDLRSDKTVMDNINKDESFTTTVSRNGKEFIVVGVKIKQDVGATTSGRDGYSFATIEKRDNLPANINEILTEKAKENAKKLYPNIANIEFKETPQAGSIAVGEDVESRRNKQLEIINKTNPAPNNYNTWIRKVEDIKTADEVFEVAKKEGAMYPDFTEEQMQDALDSGEITIYSSNPIENGVFVTPSKMNAQEYAGGKGGKLYSKKVKLEDIAWIDESEGQYAVVEQPQAEPTKEAPKKPVSESELNKKRADIEKRRRDELKDKYGVYLPNAENFYRFLPYTGSGGRYFIQRQTENGKLTSAGAFDSLEEAQKYADKKGFDLLVESEDYHYFTSKNKKLYDAELAELNKETPAEPTKETPKEPISTEIEYKEEDKVVDVKDIMGDKIGEKTVRKFSIKFPDGASAFGDIDGKTANITGVKAPERTDGVYGAKRGTKTYNRLIQSLLEKGAKSIRISNQSLDSRNAIDKLVEKGVLKNPREIRGSSNNEHPTLFDIDEKALLKSFEEKPTAKPFISSFGTPVEDLNDVSEGVMQTNLDGVDVLFSEVDGNTVKLESIETPEAEREQGKAKKALRKIIDKADELGKTIVLSVVPKDETTTEEGLRKLYEGFGFVATEGKNMERVPNAEVKETKAEVTPEVKEATPTEKPLSLAERLNAAKRKVEKESPIARGLYLTQLYNRIGKRMRKDIMGNKIFGELRDLAKENGWEVVFQKTGSIRITDKNGKEIRATPVFKTKEEKKESGQARRESKKYQGKIINMLPQTIEHYVAMALAKGTRFRKAEIIRAIGRGSDIPSWMWSDNGISLEFLAQEMRDAGFGMDTEAEVDIDKVIDAIKIFATNNGREEAFDFAEEVYNAGNKEDVPPGMEGATEAEWEERNAYMERNAFKQSEEDLPVILSIDELTEEEAASIFAEMQAQGEYESSEQYKKDLTKYIKENGKASTGKADVSQAETRDDVSKSKAERAEIAKRLRDKKIGGIGFVDPLFGLIGISKTIYDGALELAAKQVEKGTKLGVAIANAMKYVDQRMNGARWDKGLFGRHLNDQFKMTVNGKEVEVKRDLSTETLDVVNGWYSPLEKSIKDTKADSLTAKEWLDKVRSKEGEDLWTGLRGVLEAKNPKDRVSKRELLNFLKDNRVDVVEVMKGVATGSDILNDEQLKRLEYLTKLDAKNPGGAIEDIEDGSYSEFLTLLNKRDESSSDDLINLQKETEKKAQLAQRRGDKILAKKYWDENHQAIARLEELELSAEGEGGISNPTKFSQYQLEGEKENYKEVIVILPRTGSMAKVGDYKVPQAHQYGQDLPDNRRLVHLRMNTRKDSDGNKVLFLEEVQSDWGQKGKKEGFKSPELKKKAEAANRAVSDFYNSLKDKYGNDLSAKITDAESAKIDRLIEARNSVQGWDPIFGEFKDGTIPSAPFVTDTNSWVKLGVKVALKEAVAQGVDKIAWTTGEQQNERYSLEKIADEIKYRKNSDGTYRIVAYKRGENVSENKSLKEDKLEETLGKDVAQRIIDGKGERIEEDMSLTGENLKVGGKGMKGFYGSPSEGSLGIVGNVVESLTGQQPKTVEIGSGTPVGTKEMAQKYREGKISEKELDNFINSNATTQHSIDITPEIKQAVKTGLPLFGSKNEILAKAILDMKVKGLTFFDPTLGLIGISVKIYNAALDIAAKEVQNGTEIGKAIQKAVEYIDKAMQGAKWNKGIFEESVKDVHALMKDPELFEDLKSIAKTYAENSKLEPSSKGLLRYLKDKEGVNVSQYIASYIFNSISEGIPKKEAPKQTSKEDLAKAKKEEREKAAARLEKAKKEASEKAAKAREAAKESKEKAVEKAIEKAKQKYVNIGARIGEAFGNLEGQIAGKAKGIKEAAQMQKWFTQQVNTILEDMIAEAKESNPGFSIAPRQLAAITKKLLSVNPFNENSYAKAVEYMGKVLEDATYADNVSRANKLKKDNTKRLNRNDYGIDDGSMRQALKVNVEDLSIDELSEYLDFLEGISAGPYNKAKNIPLVNKYAEIYREQKSKAQEPLSDKMVLANEARQISRSEAKDEALNEFEYERQSMLEPVSEAYKKDYLFIKSLTNEELSNLSEKQLQELSNAIRNMRDEVGFMSGNAANTVRELQAERLAVKANEISEGRAFKQLVRDIILPLKVSFKGGIEKLTDSEKYKRLISMMPLSRIDSAMKGITGQQIHDAFIQPISTAFSVFTEKINQIESGYDKLYSKVGKSILPWKREQQRQDEMVKISLIAIQKEFEDNPYNEEISSPLSDYIEAIREAAKANEEYAKLADRYIEIYESMLDENGQFDYKKQEELLDKDTYNFYKYAQEINASNAQFVEVSAIRNGENISLRQSYTPISVALMEYSNLSEVQEMADKFTSNENVTPTAKSGNIKKRTKGAKPLYLDYHRNAKRATRSVLLDYYMREPLRVASKAFNKISKDIGMSADSRAFFKGLEANIAQVVKNVFVNEFYDEGLKTLIAETLKKRGYQMALASVPRAGVEFGTNLSHAIINKPKELMEGSQILYKYKGNDEDLRTLAIFSESAQISRMFGKSTSIMAEQGSNTKGSATTYGRVVDQMADSIMSAPDRAVARPLWIGSFSRTFREASGSELDIQEFINNPKYRQENAAAIAKARNVADANLSQGFASMNPFEGVVASQVTRADGLIDLYDKYMTRFMRYEFQSSVDAINALMGRNEMSKTQGAALLAATIIRMSAYQFAMSYAVDMFYSLIESATGTGDEEDEEKDVVEKISSSLTGAIISMLVFRRLGNWAKAPIAWGIETLNKNFGEEVGLRKGEYDDYKSPVVFSPLAGDIKGSDLDAEKLLPKFMGPYGPMAKTAFRFKDLMVKRGLEDGMGGYVIEPSETSETEIKKINEEIAFRIMPELVMQSIGAPIPRDVRNLIIRDVFKDYKKTAKEGSATQKGEQEDLKKKERKDAIVKETVNSLSVKVKKNPLNPLGLATKANVMSAYGGEVNVLNAKKEIGEFPYEEILKKHNIEAIKEMKDKNFKKAFITVNGSGDDYEDSKIFARNYFDGVSPKVISAEHAAIIKKVKTLEYFYNFEKEYNKYRNPK
jgi:hypothetical protein